MLSSTKMKGLCWLWLMTIPLMGKALGAELPPVKSFFSGPYTPYLSLSTNNARLLDRGVQFWGVGIGVSSSKNASLELKYVWLASDVITSAFVNPPIPKQVHLRYVSAMASIEWIKYKKLSSTIEMALGGGNMILDPIMGNAAPTTKRILLLEPAVNLQYRILEWLSCSIMTGLRLGAAESPFNARTVTSGKIDIGLSISPIPLIEEVAPGMIPKAFR